MGKFFTYIAHDQLILLISAVLQCYATDTLLFFRRVFFNRNTVNTDGRDECSIRVYLIFW